MKRIVDLDEEHEGVTTSFILSNKQFEKLDNLSRKLKISKGALARQALKEYFDKQEKPESNPTAVISDEALDSLINKCRTWYGGFQTRSDSTKVGFIDLALEQSLNLKSLMDSQFIVLVTWLKYGYEGFSSKPEVKDFIAWVEELEPTPKQSKLLRCVLEGSLELEDGDEQKSIKELLAVVGESSETEAEAEEEATEEDFKNSLKCTSVESEEE